MSEWIIIRLGRTPDESLLWARVSSGAVSETGRVESIAALKAAPAFDNDDLRIAAILPGEAAAMRALPAPPRQSSKLMSAASLLLEDELASPIDEQHIAILRRDGKAHIAAVDRVLIENWTAQFKEAELPLSVLTVDYACLGGGDDRGVLFIEPSRLIADFGDKGFAAEADLAKLVIADYLVAAPDATLGVYSSRDTLPDNERYVRLGDAGDDALFALAAAAIDDGRAINLLQGAFRPPRQALVDTSRWRRPAMMAASLTALLLGGVLADGYRANRIADRYETEARRIHDNAFPGQENVDIRANARRVLGSGGGGASFLALSDVLGQALGSHENVSIDRVRFDTARNMYVFSVRSTSDAEIASFQQSLTALGAAANETSGYRRAGAFWVGEMTVAF